MTDQKTQKTPPFAQLSAYVDGALDAEDAAEIAALAAQDPEVAQTIADIRALNADLSAAFAPAEADATAQRLDALIRETPPASAAAPPRDQRRRAPDQRRRAPRALLPLASATAAALALVLLGQVGDPDAPEGPDGSFETAGRHIEIGAVAAGAPLAELLSSAAYGEARRLDAVDWSVAGTFRDRAGRVCREIHANAAAGAMELGLACYENAAWRIEFAALSKISEEPGADPLLTPAHGPGLDALGAYIDSIGGGPQFSAEEERALLRGWPQSAASP